MDLRNRSIVLRLYGIIRNIGKFSSQTSSNNLYSPNYTGNHIVIFENQLIQPPIVSLSRPDMDKWIKHHKIDNSLWKISDIDNYMRGNPFFSKLKDQAEYQKFIDRVKTTDFDSTNVDILNNPDDFR